jgi:FkbM family methyltransferase
VSFREAPQGDEALHFHQRRWGARLGTLGKRIAPAIAGFVVRRPKLFLYASMYLDMVQGKGAGSGWDLDGEVAVALRFVPHQAPVILDVGAHEGNWTRALLKARPSSRVIQFEPAPANITLLKTKSHQNIEIVEAAVSDQAGQVEFYSASTSDLGSLHARRESIFADRHYEVISVAAITIDEAVGQRGLDRIDFLKMDIEGHELAALRGSKECLAAGKIRALSFEFGGGNINSRTFFHDYWDLLVPLGYQIFRVLPGARLLPIRHYFEDLEHFRNVSNYIASLEEPVGGR